MSGSARLPVLAAAVFFALSHSAAGNARSTVLCGEAATHLYNLDRDEAIATYREAIAADPRDAAAYRGLASALWLSITFRRGNVTVDDYLGRITKPPEHLPPPPDTASSFRDAIARALELARARTAASPRDADAHYQVAAVIGLRASYTATVEGSMLGAFRAAREAYEEAEKVLSLDSRRKDAALIVGTYRYIVATLALPLRWVAYIAGFGGGKERGLRLVEEAAEYHGDNQTDARLALVLLYNREQRWDAALAQLATLRAQYPRNRLLWLESGATNLRANRAADAERFLDEGIARLPNDPRPRIFGEEALWRYKRGAARVALGHDAEAESDLRAALTLDGRKWVMGRVHLELGKVMLKRGRRPEANEHFRTASTLCDSDNDAATAERARALLKQ